MGAASWCFRISETSNREAAPRGNYDCRETSIRAAERADGYRVLNATPSDRALVGTRP
jgi:hypothetical protein